MDGWNKLHMAVKKHDNDGNVLNTREAAEFLGVSQEWLREAARNGKIPGAVRIGTKMWRFWKPSLEAMFQKRPRLPRREDAQ